MRNNSIKTAFSLIELSIVILIIGVLIAGVVSSSKLYYKFKVQTAATLTRSSPVNGIKDLVLWYETSLDSSFDQDQNFDGNKISVWKDLNPQKIFKNNATQSSASSCSSCPTFVEKGLGGLPTLKFSGAQYLSFQGDDFISSNYTAFIVEQRTTDTLGTQTFVGSGLTGIAFGWYGSGNPNIYQMHNRVAINNTCCGDSTSPNKKIGVTRMHTFYFSQTDGAHYWLFDDAGTSYQNAAHTSSAKTPVSAYASPAIGASGSYYYVGNISEIIMFNRALTIEEMTAIEKYLGQKYSIKTGIITKS